MKKGNFLIFCVLLLLTLLGLSFFRTSGFQYGKNGFSVTFSGKVSFCKYLQETLKDFLQQEKYRRNQ